MGMVIGIALLAALAALGLYLWRAGHLSGPQAVGRYMGGCCHARGFEPEAAVSGEDEAAPRGPVSKT